MKLQLFTLLFSLLCLNSFAQQDTLFVDQGVVKLATASGSITVPPPISFEVNGTLFTLTGGNGTRFAFYTEQLRKFYLSGSAITVSVANISTALSGSAVQRVRPHSAINSRSGAAEYEFSSLDALGTTIIDLLGADYLGFRLYNWSSDTLDFNFGGQIMKCLPYGSFSFTADFDQEAGRYFPCPNATFYAPSAGRAIVMFVPIQNPGN